MHRVLRKFKNNEKGDIILLYGLLFTFMVGFLSVSVDLGMMYIHRMRMLEIGNIMRETRFTKNQATNSTFLNSYEPGKLYAHVFNEYARKNGFKGKVAVRYNESPPQKHRREYKLDMWLEDTYHTTTLRVIGIKELPIKVHIAGYGFSEQGSIWYPPGTAFMYHYQEFPKID